MVSQSRPLGLDTEADICMNCSLIGQSCNKCKNLNANLLLGASFTVALSLCQWFPHMGIYYTNVTTDRGGQTGMLSQAQKWALIKL